MKLDILAIGVHPDDVELCASGTLLKHIDMGYDVGLVDLTQGELGTRGSAQIRMREAEQAASMMGAVVRENLGMHDGFFRNTVDNTLKIISAIRRYRPEIVLANAISDRHPDHGRASKLVSEACFYSGLVKIKSVDKDGNNQEPWRPRAVYHYIQDRQHKPDFCVDVTQYYEQRMAVIQCFKSQFFDPSSAERQSPISTQDFWEYLTALLRVNGRLIGTTYAEGFTTERAAGVQDLLKLQ